MATIILWSIKVLSKINAFFKWLFKNDYGSDAYPYDDKDYFSNFVARTQEDSCDHGPDVIGGCKGIVPPIEEQDSEFYELTDPKGCRIEIYKDRKKEWRWRFFSANNKILATSGEGYKRKGSMRKSLNIVREVMPFAPVEEE